MVGSLLRKKLVKIYHSFLNISWPQVTVSIMIMLHCSNNNNWNRLMCVNFYVLCVKQVILKFMILFELLISKTDTYVGKQFRVRWLETGLSSTTTTGSFSWPRTVQSSLYQVSTIEFFFNNLLNNPYCTFSK